MTKSEIEACIIQAIQTKAKHGYTQPAAINRLWTSKRKSIIGFNFRVGAVVGQIYTNEDGTREEVLAVI
jgi:hypothetical protein